MDRTARPAGLRPKTHTVRWDGAQWVVEAIPIEQMQAQVGAAVQSMIDAVCTSGVPYFRDIFSARGYVGDPNPAYHARAVALRDWSSSVDNARRDPGGRDGRQSLTSDAAGTAGRAAAAAGLMPGYAVPKCCTT